MNTVLTVGKKRKEERFELWVRLAFNTRFFKLAAF